MFIVVLMIVVAVLVSVSLLWFLLKKDPSSLGLLFAAIHFSFTLFVLWAALESAKRGEMGWPWFFCLTIDLPLYPLVMLMKTANNLVIWLFFATVGSGLYFLIGWMVGKLLIRGHHSPKHP